MVGNNKARQARLRSQLLSLHGDDLAPPYVDPRVAALVALGVVDFAKSSEGRPRFAELEKLGAFNAEIFDDLAQLARALEQVIDTFESAPRSPYPIAVEAELDVACRVLRSELTELLAEKAPYAPGVEPALARAKVAFGPFDLAIDLRALAALVERNELEAELPAQARACARQLEEALTIHDTPELREARRALRRVWTVFEAKYQELCDIGRELFSAEPEALFPTLDALASIERNARISSSSGTPAAVLVERAMPPSVRNSVSSRRLRPARPAVAEGTPVAAEVRIDLASDSNLWLGFSQDIAEGGVFIATYNHHALGVAMRLAMQVVDDDPISVTGVVHWLRADGGDDVPPGIGVRFTDLPSDFARTLQSFASKRTPLFYDD